VSDDLWRLAWIASEVLFFLSQVALWLVFLNLLAKALA
jgi:hypothetical protein